MSTSDEIGSTSAIEARAEYSPREWPANAAPFYTNPLERTSSNAVRSVTTRAISSWYNITLSKCDHRCVIVIGMARSLLVVLWHRGVELQTIHLRRLIQRKHRRVEVSGEQRVHVIVLQALGMEEHVRRIVRREHRGPGRMTWGELLLSGGSMGGCPHRIIAVAAEHAI